MEVKASALKRGYAEEDVRHVFENAIIIHALDGYEVLVGPTRSGALFEIGVNSAGDIFHAMPARAKYLPGRRKR